MFKSKPGQIIRHRKTREPFLVIAKGPLGPLVINLLNKVDPAQVFILLPRAQAMFEPDFKMIDITRDEAVILDTKLQIVEDVQMLIEKTDLTGGVEQ